MSRKVYDDDHSVTIVMRLEDVFDIHRVRVTSRRVARSLMLRVYVVY